MTNELTLDSKSFCQLLDTATKNKHVKKIIVKGHGGSMAPFIKNKDLMTIKVIDDSIHVKKGDVVAVSDKGSNKIIVHRVIGSKNSLFQTKGDNNSMTDGWFQKDLIIGIIIKIQRHSGKTYYPKRWYGLIIAFLSKTLILNTVLLPVARYFKKSVSAIAGR